MEKRVVITGLGIIAPNGIGKEEFGKALVSGKSGIDKITSFDASNLPCQIAGEVKNFEPELYLNSRQARRMSRVAQFAVATAKMAIEDSGLNISEKNRHEMGVCFGTTLGKGDIFEQDHAGSLKRGMKGIYPLTALQFCPHSLTGYVSVEFGISGLATTMSSGCATGLDVIIWGYSQIRNGGMKAIIVGSAETPLFPFFFSALCASGNLSKRNDDPQGASRPYDLKRDGLVISEGGSAVLLEDLESALDRGARIYAEILGFGSAEEGLDMMKCDISGKTLARTIKAALTTAKLDASNIDYICAHGNSMPDYDIAETNAFKLVFGEKAYKIPISSIKSMTGQPLAAAGGFQVVASCLTLQNGIVPPTINYEIVDANCDLDYVPNQARAARVQTVLINAHSLGETHSVLILGQYLKRLV
jgi:3-oxoacyl-[acyl-carrier-protein] synthase II